MVDEVKLFIKTRASDLGFSKRYIEYQEIVKIAEENGLDESALNDAIRKENDFFIKSQIPIRLEKFKNYLFKSKLPINHDKREELRLEYGERYFNFYRKLNFDNLIDIKEFLINESMANGDLKEFQSLLLLEYVNQDKKESLRNKYIDSDLYFNEIIFDEFLDDLNIAIIDSQKIKYVKMFNLELSSCKNVITKKIRLKLKSKYNQVYFNFYNELNFDDLIDNHNKSLIESESQVILEDFNLFLDSYFNFIDEDCYLKLESKYNKPYCNYFNDFDFDGKIKKHNEDIGSKIIEKVLTSNEGCISNSKCLEIKSKYNQIDWDYVVKNYNDAFNNVHVDFESNFLLKNSKRKFDDSNIDELEMTIRGIYFIDSYVKWSYRDIYPEFKKFSECVLDFKENDEESIDYFTEKLIEAIVYISNNDLDENIDSIALISIPPSKVYKNSRSPMRKTINLIKKAYDNNLIECDKEILDFSNLLFRFSDVEAAHKCEPEDRPEKEDHINSILCTKHNFAKDNVAYLLMDDITTKATIMNACRDILIDNGVTVNNIYGLAIAETMWVY